MKEISIKVVPSKVFCVSTIKTTNRSYILIQIISVSKTKMASATVKPLENKIRDANNFIWLSLGNIYIIYN